MIDDPASSASGGGLRLTRWTPRASTNDSRFKETLAAAIDEFCAKDLQIEIIRPSTVHTGEMESVDCAVTGFTGPLTCRSNKSELGALRDAALGAREVGFDDDAGHQGPIGRHVSIRLMRSIIEKFCVAASTICGENVEPIFDQGAASDGGKRHAPPPEVEPILVEVLSHGVRFEFLLSKADHSRIIRYTAPDAASGPTIRSDAAEKFENGIEELEARLSAVLDGRTVTAGELRSWRKGSVVQLVSKPQSQARLVANGATLCRCEIARDADFFAVRLVGDGEERNEIGR